MVTLDRRDRFADSDSDLETVAETAHELYESDDFREDVIDAIRPVLMAHIDCHEVDDAAERVLANWLYKDGKGGLFQLRNQLVTNAQADLQVGDIIHMEPARDGDDRVIPYVVRRADPEDTGVSVWRVSDDGKLSISDASAGHVLFCDRFDVDRSRRGEDAHAVARELTEEESDA